MKLFDPWNQFKKMLHEKVPASELYFDMREVWWCSFGVNIGVEVDGKGQFFERPIVILKKFNADSFLGIPLSSVPKKGKYYFSLGTIDNREAVAVLSQVRYLDRKRLTNKIAVVPENVFKQLQKAVKEVNFS